MPSVFCVHIFESLHSLHKTLSVYREGIFESLYIAYIDILFCRVRRFAILYNTYSDIFDDPDDKIPYLHIPCRNILLFHVRRFAILHILYRNIFLFLLTFILTNGSSRMPSILRKVSTSLTLFIPHKTFDAMLSGDCFQLYNFQYFHGF